MGKWFYWFANTALVVIPWLVVIALLVSFVWFVCEVLFMEGPKVECPNCKTEALKAWKRCPECGANLQTSTHEARVSELETENATLKTQLAAKDSELETLRKENDEHKKKSSRLLA